MPMIAMAASALMAGCVETWSSSLVTLSVHELSTISRSDIIDLIEDERLPDLSRLLRDQRPAPVDIAALKPGESMVVLLNGRVYSGWSGSNSPFSAPGPTDEWVLIAEFGDGWKGVSSLDISNSSRLIFAIWSTEAPRVPYCIGSVGRGEINIDSGGYDLGVSALATGSLAIPSDCDKLDFHGVAGKAEVLEGKMPAK